MKTTLAVAAVAAAATGATMSVAVAPAGATGATAPAEARFTTLSNVLRSSHDTAKSAVANIRS